MPINTVDSLVSGTDIAGDRARRVGLVANVTSTWYADEGVGDE
jgi:hypothetical protein